MKIAFLTPEYPHSKTGNSGGLGTSIKNLAIGLLQKGISVRVLVYGQKEDEIFDDNGIIIQQIKNVKLKGLSWFLTRKKIEKVINQLYADKKIDLVEAPDWTGITSFIQPEKCPLIIRLHGSDTYFCHLDNRPVKWINKFHEKRALKKADTLLSVSQFTADTTNAIFGLNKRFRVIQNLIDVNLFQPSNDISSINKNIFYFGSLIRKKGLLELPLIFNKVIETNPDAKLILVGKDVPDIISGNSSTYQMMQELFSERAKANVSYLGSVPYLEIKKKIEQATVCVFPSFAEAFPVSWLEAMAMEKAIVASNIGWANEVIINDESGFLVHPKEHDLFATRVSQLLDHSGLAKETGKKARIRVQQFFSADKITNDNINFYKEIINPE
ncbi:glycosyltransferase involved in cell wall biosynthesis [Flavobacterium araucananum]|uniref:Glycoside hydrolase n=1 Tax=Flavobacterium araucananum TaxID=946678 RepID=A0A227PFV4_9FLAO|nr:glycosyltransferase family 4 protein [Flavobacterium araucananum]OXG08800.1 glycoside hydrolase [Flavobacterium araucananum]PWJ97706.1 glycosyltransferase involved in cell wall biosynthesis [Flavobacterium araucananum]